MQTAGFLGRQLSHRLKERKGDSNAVSAGSPTARRDGGGAEENEDEELLGRERRKEGADPLDLEVIDDRDLYQHLLKVLLYSIRAVHLPGSHCCSAVSWGGFSGSLI